MSNTYLITGANGEIGHSLISYLRKTFPDCEIITMDIVSLAPMLAQLVSKSYQGNILDEKLVGQIFVNHDISTVFHLASLLSTRSEKDPELAHHVNVDGTVNILTNASAKAERTCRRVKVIYPSSIAVYGMGSIPQKNKAGNVQEDEHLLPITMYGCNKLYCENLGRYYSNTYRLVEDRTNTRCLVDFRCLRFPGLISAITMPTGGTSDYGPEMLHMAAQNKAYDCFVRADTALPFMVMPDAIKSLIGLEAADKEKLTQTTYNVTSFSRTAQQFAEKISHIFPQAQTNFVPTPSRQRIVDSWPLDIDDSAARRDWGWAPDYDFDQAFDDYLVPEIKRKYGL